MSIVRVNYALITILTFSALLLSSCGSTPPAIPDAADAQEGLTTDWPTALPADHVQPWEELNAQGYVVPSDREYFGDKGTSAINALSEFVPGVEYETVAGDTSALGEGLRLTSGAVGSGTLSCATYRLTLGGVQPGVVSADVNVRPRSDDSASTYWIGLSDYGAGKWQWHGPFGDSHVRLSTTEPGADYLSPLGNMFVCVVAHDSAAVDVVGIGANVRETADTTPPDTPVGLVATPYAGVLALQWHHVTAADLAGYRVYWAKQSFSDPSTWYVQNEPYLEGANWHMLPTTPERTYVCVTAVDISGNESAASEVVSASPLADEPPVVQVTTDVLSGMRGTQVTLTATGAELYDWDLNGDGIAEVTGDTTGTGIWTFDAMGLWRPMVKGVSSDGTKAACAAVSLIITGNTRPVASATADPQSGIAPLSVTFTGTAEDGEDEPAELAYAWDFDGDGEYEADTNTLTPTAQEYASTGIYGVKFRVTDTEGAWDVDTIPVQVLPAPDPENLPPTADVQADPTSGNAPLTVDFDAGASSDTDGSIVEYAWDWDGDGIYDGFTDTPLASHNFSTAGSPEVKARVEDNDGSRATATITITVNVVGNSSPVAALTATPDTGDYPLTVTLDASASSDPDGSIVNYEWDFDGDGVYDGYGSVSSAGHTYTYIGVFTAKVRVTDDQGAQDTATATVVVNYVFTPVAVDTAGDVGWYTSLAVVDGNPAISYCDWTNGDLKYVRAGDASGSTWDTPVAVDTAGQVGLYTSLAVVDGNPAISYFDYSNDDLKYVRATDSSGSAWDTPVKIDTGGWVGQCTSLAVVDGNPAISYYDFAGGDLRYVQATDSGGTAWSTPLTLDSVGSVGRYTSLCVVDGNPAISYYDSMNYDLKYVRGI